MDPAPKPITLVKRHRRPLVAIATLCALGFLIVAGTNAYVLIKGSNKVVSEASQADPADAAIVLGAQVKPDGTMSKMLADRVAQAGNLWRERKVKRIIVSGAPDQEGMNQPEVMKQALVTAGVPAEAIEEDEGGLNTNLTMLRAREPFNVDDALIVTQGFHMRRALYLADAAGLTAEGVKSDLHGYGYQGIKSSVREIASRTKAVKDVLFGG